MPMNRTLLDPSSDFAFKKIFGTEANKNLLLSFLNGCLIDGTDKPRITNINFSKNEAQGEVSDGRGIIIDVLCEDEKGHKFLVEMQNKPQTKYIERAIYYGARIYSHQLEKGQYFEHLKPVAVISVTKLDLFDNQNKYKHDFLLTDSIDKEHCLDCFRLIYYQLPKFKKTLEELETIEDKWLYFFKNGSDEEKISALMPKDAVFIQAEHALKIGNLDKKDWYTYNSMEIAFMDEQTRLNDALKGVEEKGKQEGLKEGLEKANLKTAKNMLAMKLPIETIAQATGLTLKEIEALKNQK